MTNPTPPATEPDTSTGQGGSGGGNQPPTGGTRDTTVTGGSGGGNPNTPATQPDTTVPGPLGGVGQTGDVDLGAHDPVVLPPDTTVGGGNIGATATPAYRPPSDNPPASIRDTSSLGSAVQVQPGSPDAVKVGGGNTVNPDAAEPTDAGSAVPYTGTKDTSYYGSPPLATVPAGTGTPGAPTGVTAALVANRNAVTVSWTPPGNAAATGVIGYVITNSTGGTANAGKDATSVEFTSGLVPGASYTFTVYARTANGTGPKSAASASITLPSIRNQVADETRTPGI